MDRPLPLPRAITVVVVTVAALALVLSFRVVPHIQKGRLAAVRPAGRSAPAPAAPAPAPSKHATTNASAAVTRRVTGSPIDTQYGIVQVRVTMRGRRIVSIANVALPFDRGRSVEISQIAGPLLRSEALQAQSARIDVVSGATYTSNGYAQSLQSALDRAHA
ncbi:MAG: hypothetical protein QOH43_2342 [Solirubrobacteraceae bacterium]|jgi:uncharacterized protein with FMN-binding domain|nr:hypothetical protein [Solirubrobacteraceae bacterium]